jgi:hypothetical protein
MSTLIPADEALAILRASGVNAAKSPARGRCRTLCYLVGGQYVNLGRLRELARDAQAAQAEPAPVVAEPEAVERLGFATFNPETEGLSEALPPDCYPPVTRQIRPGVTDDLDVINRSLSRAGATPLPTRRPVLPGEPEPVAAQVAEPGPVTLPGEDRAAVAALRADAAAGRPVSLASLARALSDAPELPELPTRFSGGGFAGREPWDPGTPDARARVALQGERVATLWPIAQAVRGAGFDLPPAWWPDGPVMAGERTYGEALAALPLGAIAAAAAALAALPPVTAAQERALRLCRGEAVGV